MNMNNPHDKYFKAMMAEPDIAADFLRQFLPAEIVNLIDMETIIEISNIIPKSSNSEFMTTYEMIEQIGIEKGI